MEKYFLKIALPSQNPSLGVRYYHLSPTINHKKKLYQILRALNMLDMYATRPPA